MREMYERYPVATRVVAAAAAVGALMMSTTACTGLARQEPTIERCYDQPLPDEQPTPEQIAETSEDPRGVSARITPPPIEVEFGPVGYAKGAPMTHGSDTLRRAEAGIVRVAIGLAEDEDGDEEYERKGTGFVTTDADGNQVVVSAAHVVDTAPLSEVTLTTDDGQNVGVADGCVIFENHGVQLPLDDKSTIADTDIVALRPAQPLAVEPLTLADDLPDRGDWAVAVNYQGDNEPGSPAAYTVLINSVPPYREYTGVSGLQILGPQATQKQLDDIRFGGGSSGGPLLGDDNTVVGAVTAGTRYGNYDDREALQAAGVSVTGPGAESFGTGGLLPKRGGLTSLYKLRAAVDSPRVAS